LALTQLSSLDTCQQLPSIVNMLATGCDKKASALTDNDLAYLRGLYKMGPGRTLSDLALLLHIGTTGINAV